MQYVCVRRREGAARVRDQFFSLYTLEIRAYTVCRVSRLLTYLLTTRLSVLLDRDGSLGFTPPALFWSK